MKKKIVSILLCHLSLFAFTGITPFNKFDKFMLDFPTVGPFEKNCRNVNLTGEIIPTITTENVSESFCFGPTKTDLRNAQSKKKHDVTKANGYSVTFYLPTKEYLDDDGMYCRFMILDSSGESLYKFEFTLVPKNSQTIKIDDYKTSSYCLTGTIMKVGSIVNKDSETFLFSNTLDFFNIDSYFRLDLSSISFIYTCSYSDIVYSSIYLKFIDYNVVFPYLDNIDSNGLSYFQLPLKVSRNLLNINFDFRDKMYVNPATLEMSKTAKVGYKLTKYLYLPINKKNDLLDQEFTIIVNNFGYNQTSFEIPVRYMTDHSLIGDCSTSDYCVVGEESHG